MIYRVPLRVPDLSGVFKGSFKGSIGSFEGSFKGSIGSFKGSCKGSVNSYTL